MKNIIFIRIYGFIAAGYTTLISYILYCLGHYIFMKKVCKKHANGYNYYDYKCILSISIAFVLGVFLIIPLYQNIIARYLLIFIILTVIALNYKKIKVLLNKTE